MIEEIILKENKKNKEEMILKICDSDVVISTNFLLSDMQIYIDSIREENNPKKAIVEVISYKLKKTDYKILNFNEVMAEKDSVFESYILELVNNSDEIKKYYENTDESLSVIERFSLAIDSYGITSKLKNLIENSQQYLNSIKKVVSEISTSISIILKNIDIPTISEERKKELENNFKLWGQMGWTIIPHAELNMFSRSPKDLQSADKIALKYFNKKGLDSLFQEMRKQKIRKCDLESAIFCFENKEYKACSSILLGIIDSKMLSYQSLLNKTANRRVGKRAIEKIEKLLIQQCYDKNYFLITFHYLSLFECLNTIFAKGDDFKEEPPIINRNFVSHGMNKRKVRRKDCIKVFLALYNLVEMIDLEKD